MLIRNFMLILPHRLLEWEISLVSTPAAFLHCDRIFCLHTIMGIGEISVNTPLLTSWP